MKCIDPVLAYVTQNGKRQFRHYSLANPIFRLKHTQVFDCGTCIQCRKKRSRELATRCVLHASLYKRNSFLTLTHDEDNPSYHNNFDYTEIQKFKKKLRNLYRVRLWDFRTGKHKYHYYKKIQIFNVHEYGKNGKKHWHLVVFNHDFSDKEIHSWHKGKPIYKSQKLSELWGKGFCTVADVTEASAMYQAQYTQKDFKYGHVKSNKQSHSKHSGIGRDYFLKYYDQILRLGYIPFNGKKVPIPRYFQKLAHKHYSHFHEPSNFHDLPNRKKLYSAFKAGQANEDISNLYMSYYREREKTLEQAWAEWETELQQYIFGGKTPFQQAGENRLYDLSKTQSETF